VNALGEGAITDSLYVGVEGRIVEIGAAYNLGNHPDWPFANSPHNQSLVSSHGNK